MRGESSRLLSTDGTATAGTDYTAVPDTVLTIPANMASATVTFPFTAAVDEVDRSGRRDRDYREKA